jgi:AraC-like DNA-binding protein
VDEDSGPGPVYVERAPTADLAPFVTRLWYLRTPSPQRFERIVPLPFVHLILNLSDPYRVLRRGDAAVDQSFPTTFVSGLQTSYLINENPAVIEHVGVEFHPYGIRAFTTVPAIGLADRVLDGDTVLPGIGSLRRAVLGVGPAEALDQVEGELSRRLLATGHPHPAVVAAVRLIAADPDRPIAAIAAECGASHKTLIAQFRRNLGVGPKVFADVYRHYRFLSELPDDGPMPTWTDLVARAGYYDQPHFIRVFARFTGMTPHEYLETRRRFGSEHPSFVAFDDEALPGG